MPRSRRLRRTVLVLIGLALLGALVDGFLIEPNHLVRRAVTVGCSGLAAPVRILLFADLTFETIGKRERALRDAALAFNPDLVLIAGDLVDSEHATRDGPTLEATAEYLASIPAPAGRLLALGERESTAAERLKAAWADGTIQVVSNEARSVEVRGERLDIFVADPLSEPAPWGLGTEGGRPFVGSRGRSQNQTLFYRGTGSTEWKDIEITFAFETLDPDSLIDLRFAWREGPGPRSGTGWRIVRHEYRPDFRVYHFTDRIHTLGGRTASGFVPPPGHWCRARVRLSDDGRVAHARARFWRESEPEPEGWSIDATDDAPDRQRSGTVGFGGRARGRRYADLRVGAPDGTLFLEEPFRDLDRFRALWHYPSALADWILHPAPGAAARLILVHNPDLVLDLADIGGAPPDLVLAGHTHGGQVRLPGIGALYTETQIGRHYDFGLFQFGGVPLYITAGVGTSVIPVRFFDPPEATLLTLVPAGHPVAR